MKCTAYALMFFNFCVTLANGSKAKKSNLENINKQLKRLCLTNPENYLKEQNVVKCKISYDSSCWKETLAGQVIYQPCPFLLYDSTGNISRRCDEHGKWQNENIANCRSLESQEPANTGKQTSNSSEGIPLQEETMTHAERVKMIRLACSWIAFFILLPTFIVICVVTRRDDRFSLHKNLILAFILYILTLFIYYYGKLEEDLSRKMVCNAFWLLNLFFKAAEITWMLNESIFLVRMLLYSLDDDFYLWYYLLFGWGFSGFLTFCVYLPYLQFKIGRDSERCWVSHRHTNHVLMLHIPLTIILVINFGFAVYVVRLLAIKRKHSQTRHMRTLVKSVKATVILVFLLGFIDLVVFYQPENSPEYDLLVALLDPIQGILVCIFFVFLSAEFRGSLRRKWMQWRYGILEETNPYSASHDIEPEPSGVENCSSTDALRLESPRDSLRSPTPQLSMRQLPDELSKQKSQKSLLSRSMDLTKYRQSKVEPEPVKPIRVQSAGPEAWCPPTHSEAVTAWQEIQLSENKDELSTSGQNLEIHDIPAGNKNITFPHFGSQTSLRPHTTPQTDLETNVNAEPSLNTEEDEQEGKTDGKTLNSQDSFSFSSQEFARAFSPTTSDLSEEFASASTPHGYETTIAEPLATTAGPSIAEDGRELESGSVEDSKASSMFWHEAQQHMAQRWRSQLGHNKVMATGNDSMRQHQKYTAKQKDAEEYKLAWISKILTGNKSLDAESDA
ncbi:parathyroid hormone/parathyroid hormone-related peptide receptor-like isoform X2 [Acropora millepora]|uniref:parathyroid hormone/parathyroid hormone-related peptide receptor-like isoform X2 n=1 Tax=Acropora millepora TaxID=45264 RepID=UPI001CF12EB6|nr:parathyroid hormone/parathyroid hormone-related peptide receptor-like isoform X2 [Acropora millepora]